MSAKVLDLDAARVARSSRPEVRNPIVALVASRRLLELDVRCKHQLRIILLMMRDEARAHANSCWAAKKGPLAVFWKATAVYAGHIARVVRVDTGGRVVRLYGWTLDYPGPNQDVVELLKRRSVVNPLMGLQSTREILALPPAVLDAVCALLWELHVNAEARAEKSWRTSKPPLAAYWASVSMYAKHISKVCERACDKEELVVAYG